MTIYRKYATISGREMNIVTTQKEVRFYCDERGREPVVQWLEKLDQSHRRIIENRFTRLILGNYGDFKRVDKNILELRFHIGSGYRVYFAEEETTVVLLICGGNKKTQKHDIAKAIECFETYKRQKND